ncbi:hypothetical protein RZO31_04855 [Lactococcus lactis]|uniref:DNA-binding protein n=1 Tax=Lactococcus lactis TaxID=1358 RepID=A0AAE4NRB7_9LACT|nr:hypothetical protein [Lactococcus lactis]MDV2632206.1 hypothetical protein [Lactococcus lactis]
MKEITKEIARAIRRKKADLMLSETKTAKSIGITSDTLRKMREGECFVKDTVYVKVTQWLAEDY